MKEEQLNQAAIRYEDESTYGGMEALYDTKYAFKRGARWHESLPLAERLSEGDKAKIIMLEEEIHGEIMRAHDDDDWPDAAHYILDAMPRAFEKVFGSNLFTPTEQ